MNITKRVSFVSLLALVAFILTAAVANKGYAVDRTVSLCTDSGGGANLRNALQEACTVKGSQTFTLDIAAVCGGVITLESTLKVQDRAGTFCGSVDGSTNIQLVGDILGSNVKLVLDAKNLAVDQCAIEVPTSNNAFNLLLKNITIINSKGPGVCIAPNTNSVTLENNRIGVARNGSAAPNKIGVKIDGKANLTGNLIANNTNRGVVLSGDAASVNTIINNNSIFGNTGLGIDLVRIGAADGVNGVTLHADSAATPNDNVNLAEDVIITPLGGNNFSISANSYAKNISNLTVEIYEVDAGDVSDPFQKRDQRSYGEGKTLVQSFLNMKTSNSVQGSFTTPSFAGKLDTAYSVLLTIPARGTSEFSAVVKTSTDTNSKDPICEGEGGNGNGNGVQSPKAPTNVAAGRNPDKSVLLTFTDNSVAPAKADGFKIERTAREGAATCAAATGYTDITATLTKNRSTPPTVSFTDTSAAAISKELCYKVTAFRNIPDSGNHDLKTCVASSIVGLAPAPSDGGGNPTPTDKPPVIVVNPNPTQPSDPVVVIITDNSVNETAFCIERADKSCQAARDGDFKPNGEVVSPNPPATGGTVPYQDPSAEAGHNYCYRAKPKINGVCVASLVSNNADATKLNPDGSTVAPDTLVVEGSGGCSISNTASQFNFLSLIALLAIAPVALTRAFRFRKV